MSGEHTNAGTEKAGILIKTTLVDFPGTVACAFFFYAAVTCAAPTVTIRNLCLPAERKTVLSQ